MATASDAHQLRVVIERASLGTLHQIQVLLNPASQNTQIEVIPGRIAL